MQDVSRNSLADGRGSAGAVPGRADRVLLPDARLGRRRGRRPGDVRPRLARVRSLRGSARAPLVALPDRDERLLRHAREPEAPRTADGSRAVERAARRAPEHDPDATWIEPMPDGRVCPREIRRRSPKHARPSGSRSSRPSSTFRRSSARSSSSARCCAGRRPRSRSCWTPASRRSTARSSARARRSRSAKCSPPRQRRPWTRRTRSSSTRYVRRSSATTWKR